VKVLVDECVPLKFVRLLHHHEFTPAKAKGWGSYSNGKLLALAEGSFEVFLSCDRNVEYQQNLKNRKIAIVALSTNQWPTLRRHVALVQAALDEIEPNAYLNVFVPED
jgi:hypothetical protein